MTDINQVTRVAKGISDYSMMAVTAAISCVAVVFIGSPFTGSYNNYPKGLGYYDSFWRLTNYIKQRISVENDFINSL